MRKSQTNQDWSGMPDKRFPRSVRSVALTLGGVVSVAMLVLLASNPLSASTDRLTVRRGEIGGGQSVSALDVSDQSGTQDGWSKYIEFSPDVRRHVSILKATPEGDVGTSLDVAVNFRGPDANENRWRLQIRDLDARVWVDVFTNDDVENWVWTDSTVSVDDSSRFVNRWGRVTLRYYSSNDNDVSQLDYLGVTYSSDAPSTTTTTAAPTTTTAAPTTTTAAPTTTTAAPTTTTTQPPAVGFVLPPRNGGFDYQIGGDYAVPSGVASVSRDWFAGTAAPGVYNVCYVNAFQTQDDDDGVDRPDEFSNWPANLVLTRVAQDPNWEGEYLIDISTAAKRAAAAAHLQPMIQACADKGFDAVEFDNLDSWTRFEDAPSVQALVPFDRNDNIAFATIITERAHDLGLAVAQKNTAGLIADGSHVAIGFDFAVVEECGAYDECGDFVAGYGDDVVMIEYDDSAQNRAGFTRACSGYASSHSIVIRDRNVSTPAAGAYFRDAC